MTIIGEIKVFLIKMILFRAFSSFKYKMNGEYCHFRVTGFCYRYECSDNHNIDINVSKWNATHVNDYGVCGIIAPIHKITVTDFKLKGRWFFWKNDRKPIKRDIKEDRTKFKIYSSIPKGLTSEKARRYVFEYLRTIRDYNKIRNNTPL